jgi:chromosome partitioning protein
MTEIISVINQKGGVGKSTTAQALGQGLRELHKKSVLLIDLDAQGNLTHTLGASQSPSTAWELLKGECTTSEAIQQLPTGNIIPSKAFLSNADTVINTTGKEYRLKEALTPILKDYDYIIVDTPPALGILTINALTASTSVIIPAQADIYSVQGITQLNGTIETVKKYCNKDLTIKGIVLTRYNSRAVLNKQLASKLEDIAHQLNTKVFKAKIRDAVAVREAQALKTSLFAYAPNSNATKDYKELIKEVLHG